VLQLSKILSSLTLKWRNLSEKIMVTIVTMAAKNISAFYGKVN
jgi:hypothetical protein